MKALAEALLRDIEPRDEVEARLPVFPRLVRRLELADRRRFAEREEREIRRAVWLGDKA